MMLDFTREELIVIRDRMRAARDAAIGLATNAHPAVRIIEEQKQIYLTRAKVYNNICDKIEFALGDES